MKYVSFALSSIAAIASVACGGTTTTSDPVSQTQSESTVASSADATDGAKTPPHPHPGPPPAAYEACTTKAVGDACTVTFGSDSLAGSCVAPPPGVTDARLVCRPDSMPEPPPGEHGRKGHSGPPPAEVFAACDGKVADAACSVTLGDRAIDGACKAPPSGASETRLACVPERPTGAPR